MNLSQLKEQIRTILRQKLTNESKYNIGKLKFVNKSLSDDKILDIARAYQETPSSKFQKERDFQINAFHDLTFLLGLSPTPEQFVKTKWNIVRNAPLFKMFKDGKISRDEYKQLYSDLKTKTLSAFKGLVNSMYRVGLNKQASAQARKDMKSAFGESTNEAITNPKKSNPNDLATTVIGWFDFATDYIDDGGQRRTAIKKNDDVVKWFDSHPLDVKQKAYKIMLSKQPSIKSKIERIFGSLLKESVNEAKTYKKGDKLKIKLPNGKKFDVVFDSYSRTKGVALGKFKDRSGEYDIKPFNLNTVVESVLNEASEPEIISQLKDIVKNQQYQSVKDPKSGKKMKVDMQTANAVLQIYNGLSNVNKDNMVKMGLPKMIEVAWKIINKYKK